MEMPQPKVPAPGYCPPMRVLRFIWEHQVETLHSWIRHPVESFRFADDDDQIAWSGDVEYNPESEKFERKCR